MKFLLCSLDNLLNALVPVVCHFSVATLRNTNYLSLYWGALVSTNESSYPGIQNLIKIRTSPILDILRWSIFKFQFLFSRSSLNFSLTVSQTYRKLDVQLPIQPVLKIVPDHSITCAWQVSQAQWLRFITTDILLYITYYDARQIFFIFTNFPNFDLGKHFLSSQRAFFYFWREKGIDKFAQTFSKFPQKWYKIALIFC